MIIGTNCIGTCKLSYINTQYDQDYGEPPSPAQLRSKLVHNLKTFNNSLHLIWFFTPNYLDVKKSSFLLIEMKEIRIVLFDIIFILSLNCFTRIDFSEQFHIEDKV